jgi:RNA polymerase sigma-70 factor, ECF subfamily
MSSLAPIETQHLLSLRAGEEAAFRQVLREHGPALYSFLAHLSGDREMAKDLLQQTYLKFAQHARDLKSGTVLRAWLFTVARNTYWSHRRWSRVDIFKVAALAFSHEHPTQALTPEVLVEGQQTGAQLQTALAKVSPKYREALLLVGVEGFEPSHAAQILHILPEAFRQRLSRARAELKSLLGEKHE